MVVVGKTGSCERIDDFRQAKAEALVAAYAKHVGARDAVHQTLYKDNDRSFGDCGFHYFPEKSVLQGRVFNGNSHIKEWPESAHVERQVIAGLNDPKIGGMYDRGGGYFILDEEKQMYFLVKDYPFATTTAAEFIKDFDNLNDLNALWLMSWGHMRHGRVTVRKPCRRRELIASIILMERIRNAD